MCNLKNEMISFKIDGKKITDWNSFHSEFKSELNFPDYYGENMDAWIDCVDELTETPTLLRIENGKFLKENKPEFLNVILEYGAFVNFRKVEQGEKPNLIISTNC